MKKLAWAFGAVALLAAVVWMVKEIFYIRPVKK